MNAKKLAILLLTILLVFAPSGCKKNSESGSTPVSEGTSSSVNEVSDKYPETTKASKEALTKGFECIKALDLKGADEYIVGISTLTENSQEFSNEVLKYFDYEIVSGVSFDESTSTFAADITSVDMTYVTQEFTKKQQEYMKTLITSQAFPSDEEIESKMNKLLLDIVSAPDLKTKTSRVDVDTKITDGKWKAEASVELANAIYGDMLSASESYNETYGVNSGASLVQSAE